MSRDFPDRVDLWQLVKARRGFDGSWPLAKLPRLSPLLHLDRGDVHFRIDFGLDLIGQAVADLHLRAQLPLLCQRSLEPFDFPVDRQVRLGLLSSEAQQACLQSGYEPYVVPAEPITLVDLVEDELILVLPVVARKPGPALRWESDLPADDSAQELERASPFAVLAGLKTNKNRTEE